MEITEYHRCDEDLDWHGLYTSDARYKKYIHPDSSAHPASKKMQKEKNCVECGKSFMPSHRGQKAYQKAMYCSRSCSQKAIANKLWKEGKGNGFKIGHPRFLKYHSASTKRKLSEMFKGKHLSPQTEFKEGHKSYSFKGMHSSKGIQKLISIHHGKKNPMYGSSMDARQKKILQEGMLRKYGFKTPKGLRGLPWIDYQLNAEMFKGMPIELRSEHLTHQTERNRIMRLIPKKEPIGVVKYKGHKVEIYD